MRIERFVLIDRVLYWEERKTLVVGDLHLGYEESLNHGGVLIPKNQIRETIRIFERIFEKCGKLKEIILLGDVKHYFSGILGQEFDDFKKLMVVMEENLKKNGKIIIIKGNHDNILEPVIRNFENVELRDSYFIEDVCFLHGNFLEFKNLAITKLDNKTKIVIVGHFHPAIILKEGAKQEKYKCFLYGKSKEIKKELVIVPSFFPLIEGSDIISEINWKIDISKFNIIVLDDSGWLYDFGKVKNLKN